MTKKSIKLIKLSIILYIGVYKFIVVLHYVIKVEVMKTSFIQSNSSIITMTRGDTLMVPIFINMGTYTRPVRYSLVPGDRLYFSLTEPNQYFENGILKKMYDCTSHKNVMGDTILYLRPEDTEYLIPGQYYYEIKLQQFDCAGTEFVTTVVPKTLFNIV